MVNKMKWTKDQQSIIDFCEKQDLLVSAAAGSGKTAVMTERIRRRSLSGQVDVSKMLVMTFTDLAAQNMRDRIERSFRQALEDNIAVNGSLEARSVIDKQLMMLQQAQISTIHSFCWQIIQTWSSELTDSKGDPYLEAGLGVLDETRKKMLLEQAVDEVLEVLYELMSEHESNEFMGNKEVSSTNQYISCDVPDFETSTEPFCLNGSPVTLAEWLRDFACLFDSMSGRRDDSDFRDMLVHSLEKIRSLADYELWCREQLNEYMAKANHFASSSEYEKYIKQLKNLLEMAEEGVENLKLLPYYDHLMQDDISGKEEPRFQSCLKSQLTGIIELRRILEDTDPDKWDRIYELSRAIESSYLLPKRTEEKREFMTEYNSRLAPLMHYITGFPSADKLENYYVELPIHMFSTTVASIENDLGRMHGLLSRFCETVIMIDRAYLRLKLEEKAIDFSDFEHFALKLLRIPEVRDNYRERYQEIYLDEYQDTNNIQESIIRQIADDNVFMVGDIKQSIYRFRYANPALFAKKAERYERDPSTGRLMRLNQNFRSVPGIIDGVNRFFNSFLTEESGEIDYTKGHQLTAGKLSAGDARVKVMIVNVKENQLSANFSDDDIREDGSTAKESLAVIREIRNLIKSESCGYGDIAILARTRAVCQVYYRQLADHGIPVTAAGEREFLDSPELRLMESLINLLDNMQQDIPLAAIMRSGIAEDPFSEEDLMMIRSEDKERMSCPDADRHFYASVMHFRVEGSDQKLRQRVDNFLGIIETWREYERFMSISELIGHIYEESGLLDRVSTLDSGSDRVKDLELFREWADGFERSRQRGLYSFALYIRKIREKRLSDRGFDTVTSVENAVQIMTVHASKGLEFPIVFLAGAGKMMEKKSNLNLLAVSEHGGITGFAVDPERMERHMTALHYSHLVDSIRAERAESYRLLYVAMTRAERLLYIAANVNVNAEKKSNSMSRMSALLQSFVNSGKVLPIPAHMSAAASSWLQLLLLSMCAEPGLEPIVWFGEDGITSGHMQQSNDYYQLNWFESDWLRSEVYPDYILSDDAANENLTTGTTKEADMKTVQAWTKRLFQEYPYAEFQQQPSKLTVTGLKRLQEQLIAADSEIYNEQNEEGHIDFTENKVKEMAMTLHKPVDSNKLGTRVSGAELGSLLHSLFQFVDLVKLTTDTGRKEAVRQIEAMATKRIIYPRYLDQALEWSDALVSFAASELADSIRSLELSGGSIYREMPFTIAVKSDDAVRLVNMSAQQSINVDDDITLVQGMIDCWFEDDNGVTLVDFKSDYLDCPPSDYSAELIRRYKIQLDYYAEAITRAAGKKPKHKIIWLIRYAQAVEL